MRSFLTLSAAALLAIPAVVHAQGPRHPTMRDSITGPLRGYGGAALSGAAPVGVFGDYVQGGIGGAGHLGWNVIPGGALSIRGDLGIMIYGHERKRIPFPTAPRVSLDLTTTNNIVTYGVGPQLMATGGALRPYVNGFVGGAYFYTESALAGTGNNGESFARSENYHDHVLSYGGGGGVLIPVSVGKNPVSIDVGARYVHNGTVRYLREGDIQDDGNTVIMNPTVSPANFVQFTLGVSVGIR
ncbi:MAG TPA: hypothetical protein VGD77_13240 [Gemmatimonadaceae bacterium]